MGSSRSRYDKDAKIAPSKNMKKKIKEVLGGNVLGGARYDKDWPKGREESFVRCNNVSYSPLHTV